MRGSVVAIVLAGVSLLLLALTLGAAFTAVLPARGEQYDALCETRDRAYKELAAESHKHPVTTQMRSSSDWVQTPNGAWTRATIQQTRGLNRNHNSLMKHVFKGAATTVIRDPAAPGRSAAQGLPATGGGRHQHDLVEQLHRAMAPSVAITLLADRGFGDQKLTSC